MNFGIAYGITLILLLLIGITVGKYHLKTFLFWGNVLISIPAYSVRPNSFVYLDTIRFEYILNNMRSASSFSSMFSGLNWGLTESQYSDQPLDVLYIWLFSFFKSNGALFFGTTFLFLLFLTLLILDIKKYFNISSIVMIYIYIIELATFNLFFEIEGVRNFLSFIILAWALFNDLIKNKKVIPIISYIFCAFFHPISLIFIVIRIIMLFKKGLLNNKKFDVIISLILVTYNLLMSTIIKLLSIFEGVPFVSVILDKSQMYVYGQSDFSAFAGRSEIFFTSLILISLIVEYIIFNMYSFRNYVSSKYLTYYLLLMSFTVGSFLNMQIYLRTIMLILFLSVPFKAILFKNGFNLGNSKSYPLLFYKVSIVFVAMISFIFWYGLIYNQVLVF